VGGGVRFARVASPVGTLTLVASDAGLRAVLFAGAAPPDSAVEGRDRVLDAAAAELGEWFAGERTAFDLPLDLGVATDFQRRAWLALAEIPYGTTRSYGEQARRLGAPRAARAVGAANGRNPLPIVLPCHRLVGADGALTGFGGGLAVKRALLDHEAATAARAAAAGTSRTRTSPAPRRRT
jgi:methylated-DNA-[protein]-cysteine S-methyltransferase